MRGVVVFAVRDERSLRALLPGTVDDSGGGDDRPWNSSDRHLMPGPGVRRHRPAGHASSAVCRGEKVRVLTRQRPRQAPGRRYVEVALGTCANASVPPRCRASTVLCRGPWLHRPGVVYRPASTGTAMRTCSTPPRPRARTSCSFRRRRRRGQPDGAVPGQARRRDGPAPSAVRAPSCGRPPSPNSGSISARTAATGKRPLVFGHGDNPINFVSVGDVAALVITRPRRRVPGRQALEIGGPENITLNELAAGVQRADDADGDPDTYREPCCRAVAHTVGRANPQLGRQVRASLAMDTADLSFDSSPIHAPFSRTAQHPDRPRRLMPCSLRQIRCVPASAGRRMPHRRWLSDLPHWVERSPTVCLLGVPMSSASSVLPASPSC